MKARIVELIGIAIVGAAMLLPAPRITLRNPQLLYTLAIYKVATGDTAAALRLLRQAENGSHNSAAATPAPASHNCQEPL